MNEVSCPKCESDQVIKWCKRKTENRGIVQRYKCKSCNRFFSLNQGFWKMKNNEHKITASMDMYYSGMSLRKIQAHLKMFYPHNAHASTIYRWIVKYANMISAITDNVQIRAGEELMSDEMEYARLGDKNWFVDTLDTKSRFMVSGDFIESRTNDRMIKILKNSKMKTGDAVKVVTTDALMGYPTILRKTFGYHKKSSAKDYTRSSILHNVVKANERGFNHKIERLHGTIRDRTKIMRGFHGSLQSARMIMKGMEIYYNYVRKHQGINNQTPSELAIPQLDLGVNRWLGLIKLASV